MIADVKSSEALKASELFLLFGLYLFKIVLRVLKQFDHFLTDMRVKVVTLQCGKRQEAGASDHIDAIG